MKRRLFILLLLPFLGYTKINTFPWTHDFDNGVGLTNWAGDDGDWIIDANGTPSNNTGPSDAMTGGGNYWYVEASGANAPSSSDIAFLSSIKDSSGSPLAIRDKLLLRNSEKFLIKVNAERIVIK